MAEGRTITPPKMHRPSKEAPPARVCIFGRGGSGKTTLLSTLPGRGLVVDVPMAEGGAWVLSDYDDRISVTTVYEWDDIDETYWYLKEGKHEFQWLAVDSITGMKQLATQKTLHEKDTGLAQDPHTLDQREWGKIGTLTTTLIYKLHKIPLPIVWIAQEKLQNQNDDSGDVYKAIGPDVSPMALGALVPSMMLVGRLSLAYTSDGKAERRLRIGPHHDYITKARSHSPEKIVPSMIRNPNLGELLQYLYGKKDITLDIVVDDEGGSSMFEDDAG